MKSKTNMLTYEHRVALKSSMIFHAYNINIRQWNGISLLTLQY